MSEAAKVRYSEQDAEVSLARVPLVVGRAAKCDLRLSDNSVSRQHARLELRDGRLCVVDLSSRFGTYVNGFAVRERMLAAGDLLRFGRRQQYRVGQTVLMGVTAGGMSLTLQDVEIAAEGRLLVTGVSLTIPAGSFVGLPGPSGAGKTMLLRALAGIWRPSAGQITTEQGADVWENIEEHRLRLALIPQQDVIHPLLTLRENLELTARLRLGSSVSAADRTQRIEAALEMLGLSGHADKLAAKLSGGQRKRLSVAMEWLRKPELLLLDEPTAGLDPGHEARVMEYLAAMSRQGATVVCATHLMENVRLFDHIGVLGSRGGQGLLVYTGAPEGLLGRFGCRHYADLYELLASGRWLPEEAGPLGELAAAEPPEPVATGDERVTASKRLVVPLQQLIGPAPPGTLLGQVCAVAQRSALTIWRDRWLKWILALQPLVLAVLVGVIQFAGSRLDQLFFFSLVVACWLGMNNSIRDLVRDRRHYIRDRLAGLLPEAYLAAKAFVFIAVGLGQLVVFLLVLKAVCRGVLPESDWNVLAAHSALWWLLCLLLVHLCGLALALLVSAVVRSEEAAVAWLPLLILPQILISSPATGLVNWSHTDARPFRPIVVTLRHPTHAVGKPEERLSHTACVLDAASLLVYTRPALLAATKSKVDGWSAGMYWADVAHLTVLLLLTCLGMYIAFRHAEKHWPALVGY